MSNRKKEDDRIEKEVVMVTTPPCHIGHSRKYRLQFVFARESLQELTIPEDCLPVPLHVIPCATGIMIMWFVYDEEKAHEDRLKDLVNKI